MQHFDKSHFRIADDVVLENNKIPLTWWTNTPNFGDLLSPYLIEQLTSKTVKLVDNKTGPSARFKFKKSFSYLAIGSIISRANAKSIVWGSGAFGTETARHLNKDATYLAVRGPLTRNLLRINGITCPEVYGDPALLMPSVFNPDVKKKYKIGVILRWSETDWHGAEADSNVKKINLGTSDIEGTLTDILSCEKIVSSSLHGVILADAYGIPSAWLSSTTPKGLEFKFYDYFISVDKIQKPQQFDFSANRLSVAELEKHLEFDSREIKFDLKKLLVACPLVKML